MQMLQRKRVDRTLMVHCMKSCWLWQIILEKQPIHTGCVLSSSCRLDGWWHTDASRPGYWQLWQSKLLT